MAINWPHTKWVCVFVTFYISGNSFLVILHFNTIVESALHVYMIHQTHIFVTTSYTGWIYAKKTCRFSCIHHQHKKSKDAWTSHFTFIVGAAPFAFAQWTAMESSSMTLAATLTGNHKPALEEQQASLADVWQIRPIWHPLVGSGIPFPAPVTWIWYLRDSGDGLLPDESCCVKSPLGMPEESILGRWDGVERLDAMNEH